MHIAVMVSGVSISMQSGVRVLGYCKTLGGMCGNTSVRAHPCIYVDGCLMLLGDLEHLSMGYVRMTHAGCYH